MTYTSHLYQKRSKTPLIFTSRNGFFSAEASRLAHCGSKNTRLRPQTGRFGCCRTGNGRTLDFGPAKNGPPATVPPPQLALSKSIRSRSSARNIRPPMSVLEFFATSTCSVSKQKLTYISKNVRCLVRIRTKMTSDILVKFIISCLTSKVWTSWEGCQWTAPTEESVCLQPSLLDISKR